jgi:hypothetical protein
MPPARLPACRPGGLRLCEVRASAGKLIGLSVPSVRARKVSFFFSVHTCM